METHRTPQRYSHIVCIVLTLFLIIGLFGSDVFAATHDSLLSQPTTTIAAPPVILQAGTAGSSTIYANNTSATVNVTAPEYQYVTQQSNVDGVADIGSHSSFVAQQAGPDSVYDNLSEANTVSPVRETYVYGSANVNPGSWTNPTYAYNNNTADYASKSVTGIGWTGYLVLNCSDTVKGTKIQYWFSRSSVITTFTINIANQTGTWLNVYNATPTLGSYQNATFTSSTYTAIEIQAYKPSGTGTQSARINEVQAVNATWTPPANYELDLEEQWTNANSTAANEEIDIYMGAFSTPASILSVQWYNTTSSSWLTIISSLNASTWNNVTVVNYLTSSTFTIQFVNTTSGTTQSWWQIDCSLLHLWTNSTYDYVLNIVNQVTGAWNVSLQVYGSSNIARLSSAIIRFHDGTSSNQIVVNSGSITQSQGALYILPGGAGSIIYISISNLLANATGSSYVNAYLKILTPSTTTYAFYIITFEID